MTEFHFANPAYLLLLLALPLLQVLVSRFQSNAREKLLRFVSANNLRTLLKERGKGGGGRKRFLFWIGMILLVCALARPQANPKIEAVEGASLDIYLLLDVSRSMDAEDVAPSRLAKAKHAIQSLTQLLAGDRIGVIAFAGSAVMISPLTADYEVVKSFLQNVDTSMIQNQGTNITGALTVAEAAMKRGAEKVGQSGPRSNVFVVLSDGEDHAPEDLSVVDRIKNQGGIIFSIAFGTEAGGTIPVRNERGELSGHKRDRSGAEIKTTVQTKSLEEIAQRGGGQFYFSTQDEGEIRDILQRVQNLDRHSAAAMKAKIYEELFAPILAVALALLIFSFFSVRTVFTGFTGLSIPKVRGIKLPWAIVLLFPFAASQAHAAPLSFLWDQDKRAFHSSQEMIQAGKSDEAVNRLKSLLAENPDSPELNFDIGTYLLDAKKNDEGRTQLQRLVDRPNPLREKALFNIAGSYAQEQKKDEARAAYAEMIHSLQVKNRSPEESQLLDMAKQNLSRLETDPPQKQQPQSGGGESKDQKQDQDKKDGQSKDGKDGKSDQSKDKKDQGNNDQKDKGKDGQDKKDQGNNDQKDKGKDGQDKKDQGKGDDKKDQGKDEPKKDDPGKDGKDAKDKDEKDKGKDKDGDGQPQDGKEADHPPPPGMRPGKKPYKEAGNMPEADAKRILEALKQKENSLQKSFLKKRGKEGKFSDNEGDKDW